MRNSQTNLLILIAVLGFLTGLGTAFLLMY